jgi:hypothetical protein
MNTLYVLKGGMKFKFLALTVVVLLGFGVGNTAWGQTTIDNSTDVALDWHTGSSWTTNAPDLAANNLVVSIVDDMISNSAIVFSQQVSSFKISAGKTLRIKGDFSFQNGCNGFTLEANAKIIIEGNANFPNGTTINVATGASLVVHGNASMAANLTLDGNFLVSGDLDFTANILTVNTGGTVVVGNDFNISTDVSLGLDGFIGVFGDMAKGTGNFSNNSGGELVVLGELTGCAGCNGGTVLESDDPVWSIVWGINSLYWEDFVVGNTKGGYSILNGYGVISGDQYTFNNTTAGLDAVVWESVNRSADCNDRLKVTYDLGITNGGSSTVKLQYSVDGGTVWQDVPAGNFPARQVKLRLNVEDLPNGAVVTLDNIHVSGTNEGGTPADLIVWGERALVVCPTEIASYTIANGDVYSSILWEVVSGGAIQGAANKSVCLVQWTGGIMRLKVTVTGGSCGPSSQQVVEEFDIAESDRLRLAITHFKAISCNDAENGELTVAGQCSPNNGEVLTYDWITNNGVIISQNETSLTAMIPGEYTVTVRGATSGQEDTKTITLIDPEVLAVTFTSLNNFLCAGHEGEGSFTVVPTGGTSPYTVAVNGTSYPDPVDWAFINLPNGTYNIVVTDAHGCVAISEVVVQLDTENPTFTNFPANVQMDNATYNAGNAQDVSVLTIANQTFTGPQSDAVVFTSAVFSLARFHNARLTFSATQGVSSWTDAHYLRAEVSVDNGSSWTQIFNDVNTLNSATVTASLGASSDLKKQVLVRFTVNLAAGQSYSLTNVKVVADEQVHILPVTTGGGHLITCSDNSGSCATPTYIDSDPIWSGSCTSYANGEFRVERVWTTSDACRSVSRTQYLSVGTAPVFTVGSFPVNELRNFCNNTPTIIDAPEATDFCGTAIVSWVVRNSDGDIIKKDETSTEDAVGTGDLTGITFPADAAGDNDLLYTVTWTATDEAHMTLSQNQTITIKPAIAATITAPNLDNVCKDENVVFTVTPRGGTGTFNGTSFTPAGGTWNGTTYIFTTSLANVQEDETVTVNIQDVAVVGVDGVCNQGVLSKEFDVHDLIPTGGIIRE